VRFDTAAEGVSVEVTAEGVTVSGDEQAPGGRRRLMETEDDSVSATGSVSSALTTQDFYLADNGVTVKCPGVAVGASFDLNGVIYTKRGLEGLKGLVGVAEAALVTSCTSGVTDMSELFYVRGPPSRVLPLLRCRIIVVGRPLSPRSAIAAHSTRPPVLRCAVGSLFLQSVHRCMGRELGDEHG
jgi:hypothetical protein